MAGIGSSLSRLRILRDLFEKRLKTASGKTVLEITARPSPGCGRSTNFGTNPGNLRMYVYVPDGVD